MYPNSELRHLAFRKQRLLRRIGQRREECIEVTGRLAVTVRVIDTWRERISNWSSIASTFLPFFLRTRAELKKPAPPGKLSSALRWAGLGWKLVKGLRPLTCAVRGE